MKRIIFLIIAIFSSLYGYAQSPYIDTISNTKNRLCANFIPQQIPVITCSDTAVYFSRISIDGITFTGGIIAGNYYLDYQVGVNWYSWQQGSFSISLNQALSMYAARAPLFQYLKGYYQLNFTWQ